MESGCKQQVPTEISLNSKEQYEQYKRCLRDAHDILTSLLTAADDPTAGPWLLDVIEKLVHANAYRQMAVVLKKEER